jgi:SAM-dependent methyltransferase
VVATQWQQLNKWYQQPLGHYLLTAEQRSLVYVLGHLPGVDLVQVGGAFCFPLPLSKRQFYWSHVVPDVSMADSGTQVVGDLAALPVLPQSFDVVLLPHTLEFVAEPQSVLRQAESVLRDGGYLVLFVFNPMSLWGLRYYWPQKSRQAPWSGNFWPGWRLRKWAYQLGLSVKYATTVFYRPPFDDQIKLQQWSFVEGIGQICWPNKGASSLMVMGKNPQQPIRLRLADMLQETQALPGSADPVN